MPKSFFLMSFSRRGKLGDRAGRGRFACLTARIGITSVSRTSTFYVFAACEHVVESAVADVVSPTVAAENPYGFFDEAVLHLGKLICYRSDFSSGVFYNFGFYRLRGFFAAFRIEFVVKPQLCGNLHFCRADFKHLIEQVCDLVSALQVGEVDAESEFRVVLEQAVRPCGTVTVLVGGVGARGRAAAVNGGAARSVCDDHSVAEQLCYQLDVRRFAAAGARS